MKLIAEEISPLVHISLMSQYYPTQEVVNHPILGRNITREEYETVVSEMEKFGLNRGWLQEYKVIIITNLIFLKLILLNEITRRIFLEIISCPDTKLSPWYERIRI